MNMMGNKETPAPAKAAVDLARSWRLNYTPLEYLARILWAVCWFTVWQLAFRRLYMLRPLLLRAFGCRISLRVGISASCWIAMPWRLQVGEYSSLGPRCTVYNLGRISIGRHTTISQDVYLCAGTHDYKDPAMPLIKETIAIGDQVWIAAGACVGPGVATGEGAGVGARAVVMKDVPPWPLVAGNPARESGK
ncbi:MAG: putative colanic acid biosynthesis acetyltransferase, partial [Planctomycetota bacterium]